MLRVCGDLTQSQIADRIGISQMHVSRLLSHAQDLVRAQLEGDEAAWTSRPLGSRRSERLDQLPLAHPRPPGDAALLRDLVQLLPRPVLV